MSKKLKFMQMVHSPLGEALVVFAGEPGAPQVPAWQLRPPLPPQSEQAPRVMHAPPPLPQPLSAGASLAITQLQLLGRVFGVLDEDSQQHVLESLTVALAAEALPGVVLPIVFHCRLIYFPPCCNVTLFYRSDDVQSLRDNCCLQHRTVQKCASRTSMPSVTSTALLSGLYPTIRPTKCSEILCQNRHNVHHHW